MMFTESALTTRGYFITLEGIEGAGKSTMLQCVQETLTAASIPYIQTREPGGTLLAERIRNVLLDVTQEPISADAELLLMFASRAQHIQQVILPTLCEEKWLISDRFTDATYAYQGGGRGIPELRISQIEDWVQGGLQPDCTILLDLPVEVGRARMKKRNAGSQDRIEQEQQEFFERVRAAYLERARQNPTRYEVIDANQPMAVVEQAVRAIIERLIEKKRQSP